ncbi:MAG TPA: helix-turn-helix domain-containing protein [Thermomicrobiales bacterium]|nr:helix-turn-helix domain-containing protein [Thermomicrobiales bacterium]
MVRFSTLDRLAALEAEMDRAGRPEEQRALREARIALARADQGFVTTGVAAARLGVSIPTVKRWVARGTLVGGALGTRWLVSNESIERVLALRRALAALDREGNPTPDELAAPGASQGGAATGGHVAPA